MVIVLASAFVPRKSTAAIVALANVALAKTSTIRMRFAMDARIVPLPVEIGAAGAIG
jgi:hypothetical protein